MDYDFITTIGQDSHRFSSYKVSSIKMAGVDISHNRAFEANSDGDVVLHAITNAISGITGNNILGGEADRLCLEEGIKDSIVFLKAALRDLEALEGTTIVGLSLSIECLVPKINPNIDRMKDMLSSLLSLDKSRIGITATTGEGLTEFGRGEGVFVTALMTFRTPSL